jgi:hypothetical protein
MFIANKSLYIQMTAMLKYTLKDFNDIAFNGFNLELPDDVVQIISGLAKEVGSPDYVKTPVFKKRDNPMKNEPMVTSIKKKKGNRGGELNDEEWGVVRSFQTTKLEDKIGLDAKIDVIRSYLNKMTDKNYIDMRNKIIEVINNIITDNINDDDMSRVSTIIFEIASTNRFFSKIYADLYSDLLSRYDEMKTVFENSLNKFTELFDVVEFVESTVDYDRFCKNNKDNEKRKALSAFFINLMKNNIIAKEKIIEITVNLLFQINTLISIENKKNEVDELTENIALLYQKELYDNAVYDKIDGMAINELICKLAHSKNKDYNSLTNKAIFKFMDLIEM